MKVTLLTLFMFVAAGCSFTNVKGALQGEGTPNITVIAVLPPHAADDIARERLQTVHHTVRSELQSKGFTLIDDAIVRRVCGDSECKNRAQLFKKFGAQVIVTDTVNSVRRANFLAGYINTISGELAFVDADGKELFSVNHVERERGGVLFNSGQLVQAVMTTADNANSDDSFGVLAGLYAKNLVDEVPAPKHVAGSSQSDIKVDIASTEIKSSRGGADLVCVHGTPNLSAFLMYARERSSLRETSPGLYCGVYRLEDFPTGSTVNVELRSPYGDAARAELKIPQTEVCDLGSSIKVLTHGKMVQLEVGCAMGARYARFVVYRAAGEFGSFQKVGEFKGKTWTDSSARPGQNARYAVVAISPRGDVTSPVVVSQAGDDSRAQLQ